MSVKWKYTNIGICWLFVKQLTQDKLKEFYYASNKIHNEFMHGYTFDYVRLYLF